MVKYSPVKKPVCESRFVSPFSIQDRFRVRKLCLKWYQSLVLFRLLRNPNQPTLLFMPVGCGKTRIALAFALAMCCRVVIFTAIHIVGSIREEVEICGMSHCVEVFSYYDVARGRVYSSNKNILLVLDETHLLLKKLQAKKYIQNHFVRRFTIGLTGSLHCEPGSVPAQLRLLTHATTTTTPALFPRYIEKNVTVETSVRRRVITIDMGPTTARLCDDLIQEGKISVDKKTKFASHHFFTRIRKVLSFAKVGIIQKFLEEIPSFWKVLVCSEFVPVLQSLSDAKIRRSSVLVTSAKTGTEYLARFRSDGSVNTCFCLCRQIGSGINLGFVDVFIQVEPTYTRTQEQQLIGRCTRLGQKPKNVRKEGPLFVQFVFSNSIEQSLIESNTLTVVPQLKKKIRMSDQMVEALSRLTL
jgi:hypothetical protein